MNGLENQFKECLSRKDFIRYYFSYLSDLLAKVDTDSVGKITEAFEEACEKGRAIYFIGNGGSAVTASHIARDIGIGTRTQKDRHYKAISLVDNIAVLTAIANDEDYSKVFVRQLEAVLLPEDVVVAFSVSGNSQNLIEAFEFAEKIGAVTIACTGFDGGRLKKMARISLHIPSPKGEYGPVEDFFSILGHLLSACLKLERCGHL